MTVPRRLSRKWCKVNCLGCGDEVVVNEWGNWCDKCGGVILAGKPPRLFFRHVATVDGKGGRFPIIYDLSSASYGVAWPRKVTYVTCIHCGGKTPGDDPREGLARLDDLKVSFNSKRGSLEAMMALIQPIARGDSDDFPEISAAKTATQEEENIVIGLSVR